MYIHQGLELWGGTESTINRVGDRYFDQNLWSGHRDRVEADLSCIAALGIRTLRLPLLWEFFDETGTAAPGDVCWDSFDRTLAAMQRLYLQPIVGLVHHGSGPRNTDLLDSAFPEKLAAYALQIAKRYPWVMDYTPVNEPHTTARFSCLYGHWYPHHHSVPSYLRALLHEVRATVLAMQAIRTIQPEARLIYTEDGGSIFSTPECESYRLLRDSRRWLGTDLLCGIVTEAHPLYEDLLEHGISPEELRWFVHHPCPPAVLGLNYYLTSDRFLDHRVDLYPQGFCGGETGTDPLVDIEALRVRPEPLPGVQHILDEAWRRYGLPVAITEVHLCGSPEDQIRWLHEIWTSAQAARDNGVDVRAVTVWALFGSWNWSNLCTRDANAYEPGVFDTSAGMPQATAYTGFVQQLATGKPALAEALQEPGWWTRPDRITFAAPVDQPA